MLLAALRDMQWRRRRFLIAMIGTGLVFAMSLVASGVAAAFRNEMSRSIRYAGADRWLVPSTVSGPLTAVRPFPVTLADQAGALAGVNRADPVVFARSAITTGAAPSTTGTNSPPASAGKVVDVNLFGVVPDGVGAPHATKGRSLSGPGEAVIDRSAGAHVGDLIQMAGRELRVVGTLSGATMFDGAPNVYTRIDDAQQILFNGQPLATAVLTRGVPADSALPNGVKAMTPAAVKQDALRILKNAMATIDFVNVLLWLIAAAIMGSILYLTAIERSRDIAVFKATGAPTRSIVLGMVLQAVLLAAGSSLVAVVLSLLIGPLFPVTPEVPTMSYVAIPVVAVVAGLLAGAVAIRRAVTVQPALAFGG
jgi:putative ABC transport system permease protein